MSDRLNSISKRLLSVSNSMQQPIKKDATIEFLQNSGIGFETCSKCNDTTIDFNTGFGQHNVIYLEQKCTKPELKTPLYQENFLREFASEEAKAAARHALGIYNKGDVVAMSLLTAESTLPSVTDIKAAPVQQLKKGDAFFAPLTTFSAVYDSEGKTLTTRLNSIQTLITEQKKEITKLTEVTSEPTISSLGDVKVFLQGFNNGDVLKDTLDEMDQEMLRFEKTGQITSND